MAIAFESSVTLDESAGLQNNTSTPSVAGDADDNDILAGALPAAFSARLGALGAGAAINGALSGYTGGANTGANAFSFTTPNATGMAFTDALGAALDGAPSGMTTTAGDVPILLYTDTANDNIVLGKAGGVIVFAAYLEETGTPLSGAKLWMAQYSAIRNATADHDEAQTLLDRVHVSVDSAQAFSLANAPSGQHLFLMMGDASTAIVVTGMDPANQSAGESITTGDTVNTSQGGGSTTIGASNQMVDLGEGMFFTFVHGADPGLSIPNLDQNEADLESNIAFSGLSGEGAASFTLSQLQKGKLATVTLSAFTTVNEDGDAYIDNLHNNTAVKIDTVTVRNAAGAVVTSGIGVSFAGDQATVSGLQAGYTVDYTTAGDHNRLLVQNTGSAGSKASFDIGGFKLLNSNRTTDEIGSQMRFEDAGPSATLAAPVDTGMAATQDADSKGANSDVATQSFAAAFSAAASSYGSDGAGSTSLAYAFQVASQGGPAGLSSHGAALQLFLDGAGKVLASTAALLAEVNAANTVFDIAVDTAGLVTLTQYAQIDHAAPGVGANFAAQQAVLADGLVELVGTATITDADGDSNTARVALDMGGNLGFDDDGPVAFVPDAIGMSNSGSAVASAALHAAGSEGADVLGSAAFVDVLAADNFLYALDGTTLLKSGGQNIVLSGYGTQVLTGTTTGGQTVFTATLDNLTDQYTIDFDRTIDDGAGTSFLGAAPVKSGNPVYNLIDNVGGTTLDLLFSGGDTAGGLPSAHTVNVSTTGAGVDNQSMNAAGGKGETLRIDFTTGAALAGSPNGSDFTLGAHKTVNGYSFLVSQNTPSGSSASAYIKVYDADDDKLLVGDTAGAPGTVDTPDTITAVLVNGMAVYDGGGGHTIMVNGRAVTGILHAGGVVITGLNEGATGDGTGGDDPRVTVRTADGLTGWRCRTSRARPWVARCSAAPASTSHRPGSNRGWPAPPSASGCRCR